MIENRQRNQDISVEFLRRARYAPALPTPSPRLGFVFLGVFPSFRATVRPVCVYISLTPPPSPALFPTVSNLLELRGVHLRSSLPVAPLR